MPDGANQDPINADNEFPAELLCIPTTDPVDGIKLDGWPLKRGWYYHDTPILDDLIVAILNGTSPYSDWNKSEAEFYRRSTARWSWYFPVKIKRRHVSQLLYNSESYTVRRRVVYATEFDSYSVPFVGFVPPVSNDQYVKRFTGLMDDPESPCETTHTFHPSITINEGSELSDKSDKIPLQKRWARLVPFTLTGNNEGIDVWARIVELFPYPPEGDPSEIARVDELRAYAFHVCNRMELDVDTRLFDDMAYKGADVLDWRYQPNIAWQTDNNACMPKSESRTPFNSFGDLAFLGYQPDENSEADVWVQARITFPTEVPIQRNLMELGLPALFLNQYNPTTGLFYTDTSKRVFGFFSYITVSQNSGIPGPVSYIPGFDARKYWLVVGQFTPPDPSKDDFKLNLSAETFPCCAMESISEAIKNAPQFIAANSSFVIPNGPNRQTVTWSAKYHLTYDEITKTPIQYELVEPPTVTPANETATAALTDWAQWLTDFYLNAANYKQVGSWRLLDHPNTGNYGLQSRNVCAEAPIYGHSALVNEFDLNVEMNPWGWAASH